MSMKTYEITTQLRFTYKADGIPIQGVTTWTLQGYEVSDALATLTESLKAVKSPLGVVTSIRELEQ